MVSLPVRRFHLFALIDAKLSFFLPQAGAMPVQGESNSVIHVSCLC